MFCTTVLIECISWLINVTNNNDARWEPETNLWYSLHTWVGMKLPGCTRKKNVLQDFINVSVVHNCSATRAETFGFSADAKRQRRDVDHSPLSSVKLKNEWRYNSIPSHAFISWSLGVSSLLYTLELSRLTRVEGQSKTQL